MKFEIPNIAKDQINLILDNKVIHYNEHIHDIDYICNEIRNFSSFTDEFVILHSHEVITHSAKLESIYDLIDELDIKIYIHSSVSNQPYHGVHPLVNIWMWSRNYGYTSADYYDKDSMNLLFRKDTYLNSSKININKKTIKSILSSRTSSGIRDYIFSNINKDDVEINRYINYTHAEELNEDIQPNNRLTLFPSFNELLDEYYSSIFSFIIETDNFSFYPIHSPKTQFQTGPQLSEKTIIPFLTGTIPIIIGQKHLISDLEKMGFWIANKDFGYSDGDEYIYYKYKANRFIRCIKNINKLSFNETKQYWLDNKDKIYNNWNIVSTLFKYTNKSVI